MKKSTLLAILVFLSAIAGALGAMFLYVRRREAELEEYERLLFSEDFSYDQTSGEGPLEEVLPDKAGEAAAAVVATPAVAAKPMAAAKKAPAKKLTAK